jgi:hypothetical protein
MNANIRFLLWLDARAIGFASVAVLAAVFLATGIYVVSGRWAAGQPKRDARALARWEAAKRRGFWRFALRSGSLPAAFVYFYAAALIHAWRRAQVLALSNEETIETGILALVLGSMATVLDWIFTRRRAEEVHDRAARMQDERTL